MRETTTEPGRPPRQVPAGRPPGPALASPGTTKAAGLPQGSARPGSGGARAARRKPIQNRERDGRNGPPKAPAGPPPLQARTAPLRHGRARGGATKRRGPAEGGGHSPGRRRALVGPLRPARPAGAGERAAGGPSPLLFAPRARRSGERVAAAGRCGPGREGGSPAEAREGSGGRRRRRCSVLAAGSFRPHQGRAAPGGPREAGRGERGRSPWRLVAILVLLLRGAECPLPARLPPPSAPPPPPPGWLPRPGPTRPPEESGWGMAGGGSGPSGSAGTARSPLARRWWFIKNN